MRAFRNQADIRGVRLKKKKNKKKASFEKTNIFIGIEGSMPNRNNSLQLAVLLPTETAKKWSSTQRSTIRGSEK